MSAYASMTTWVFAALLAVGSTACDKGTKPPTLSRFGETDDKTEELI